MRRTLRSLVLLAWGWGLAIPGSATPTDADATWGTNGIAALPAGTTQIVGLQPLADGGTLVALHSSVAGSHIIRFGASGQRDLAFGVAGAIEEPSDPYATFDGMAVRADGRLSVLWQGRILQPSPNTVVCDRVFGRYLPSGLPDTTFGTQGELAIVWGACAFGHVLDSHGWSYGFSNQGGMFPRTWLVRDTFNEPAAPFVAPFDFNTYGLSSLRIDAADRLVAVMYQRGATRSGLIVGRSGTPAFGSGGIARIDLPGEPYEQGAFGLADGRVVAFGITDAITPDGAVQPVIARFTANGAPDPAFGNAGLVVLPLAKHPEPGVARVRVLAMPDERLLVVADIRTAQGLDAPYRVVLARLTADGRLDATFARGGVAELPLGDARLAGDFSNFVGGSTPAIRASGAIVLPLLLRDASGAETPTVLQLEGGDLAAPLPFATRRAIEYFHAEYGHYFVTADAEEIAILDGAPVKGWQRTGQSFDVFAGATAPLAPACRFWSDQTFAPKSSHFYTPYAGECATVKQSPDWLFERNAFELRLPVGAEGARECPAGTTRLYRAFNNMVSGAPNHRYTSDPAILDAMIAQGWTFEGEAATRVFACLPAQ